MAVSLATNQLKQGLKHGVLWHYLKVRARREGIDPAALTRVKAYLDNKFGRRRGRAAAELQRSADHFPGLTATPVYDPYEFDWVRPLEEAAQDIRGEFFALRAAGKLKPHPQNLADAGAWNTYFLYSNGIQYEDHCAACPATAAAVSQMPGAGVAGGVYFSVMTPGTHVKPHCGPVNTKIRCHLGLVVPSSSIIRVGTRKVHWRELGCIVFDDSFDHEVWNPDAERAVLIVDLWHPDLTPEEQWAIRHISQASGRNRGYRRDINRRR